MIAKKAKWKRNEVEHEIIMEETTPKAKVNLETTWEQSQHDKKTNKRNIFTIKTIIRNQHQVFIYVYYSIHLSFISHIIQVVIPFAYSNFICMMNFINI